MKLLYLVFLLIVISECNCQIVVIDPGHNYDDIGVYKTELEIMTNWNVANKLYNLIVSHPILDWMPVLTRENNLSGNIVSLSNRELIANTLEDEYNGEVYFLSIHCNAGDSPNQGTGTETFYCTNEYDNYDRLQDFAQSIHNNMVEYGKWYSRRCMTNYDYRGWHLGVLDNLTMPHCLNEIGFVDNDNDAVKLETEPWRQRFSHAYYQGLLDAFSDLTITNFQIYNIPSYENNNHYCKVSITVKNESVNSYYGKLRMKLLDLPFYNLEVNTSEFCDLGGEEITYILPGESFTQEFEAHIPFTMELGKIVKLESLETGYTDWIEVPCPDNNKHIILPINGARIQGVVYDAAYSALNGVEVYAYQPPVLKSYDFNIWNDLQTFDPTIDYTNYQGEYEILVPSDWEEAIISIRSSPNYDEQLVSTSINSTLTHSYTNTPVVLGVGSGANDCSSYPSGTPEYPRIWYNRLFERFSDYYLNGNASPAFACLSGKLNIEVEPIYETNIDLVRCGAVSDFTKVLVYSKIVDVSIPYERNPSSSGYFYKYKIGLTRCDKNYNPLENEILREFSIERDDIISLPLSSIDILSNLQTIGINNNTFYKLRIGTDCFAAMFEDNHTTLNIYTGTTNYFITEYLNIKPFYAAENQIDIHTVIDIPLEVVAGEKIIIHPGTVIDAEFEAKIDNSIRATFRQ